MESPYATPREVESNNENWLSGILAKFGAAFFGIWFVVFAIRFGLQLLFMFPFAFRDGEELTSSSSGALVGILFWSGVWLAILFALTDYLWKLGNHFLHPETHGFDVRDREEALRILEKNGLQVGASAEPVDAMYASESLRELIRTYGSMDRQKFPQRVSQLLVAIQSHDKLKGHTHAET